MKKSTYKLIDILVFTLLTCAVEAVNVLVLRKIFVNEVYSLSVVVILSIIVYMRWGEWGLIPSICGALVFALCAGAGLKQLVIYGIGNLGVIVCSIFTRGLGRKKLKENFLYTILMAVSAFAAVILLRTGLAVCFNVSFVSAIIAYSGAELFNVVIGILILFVASRQNGIFEYQEDYLKRVQEEKKKEERTYGA